MPNQCSDVTRLDDTHCSGSFSVPPFYDHSNEYNCGLWHWTSINLLIIIIKILHVHRSRYQCSRTLITTNENLERQSQELFRAVFMSFVCCELDIGTFWKSYWLLEDWMLLTHVWFFRQLHKRLLLQLRRSEWCSQSMSNWSLLSRANIWACPLSIWILPGMSNNKICWIIFEL